MALDVSNLMMRLNPMRPLDLGDGQQLEQMRLLREKFEEEKRQHREAEQLRKLEEQGRTAREQLLNEREEAQAAAAKEAKLQENRLAAQKDFLSKAGAGDIEGAEALVPYMTSLGMGVENLGSEGGLPTYRVDLDRRAAERQALAEGHAQAGAGPGETAQQSLSRMGQNGIGYPQNDQGALQEPPGIGTTEEAYGRAQDAMALSTDLGTLAKERGLTATDAPLPSRSPDEVHATGGVARNVIDMGAIHDETLRRLNPVMSGLVGAYPEAFRASAQQTADAASASGLPVAKAMEAFAQQRSGPNNLIQAELERQAKTQQGEQPNLMQREGFYQAGYDNAGKVATQYDIKEVLKRRDSIALGMKRLTNKDTTDDYLVGALVSRMMGERGATTEPDVERALGTAAMDFISRIKARLYKEAIGGLSAPQKQALMNVLKDAEAGDKAKIHEYLDNLEGLAGSAGQNEDKARGVRDFMNLVPKPYRDEWAASKKKEEDGKPVAAGAGTYDPNTVEETGDFDKAFDDQAKAAGLDPAKLRPLVHAESGGKAGAVNKDSGASGLIQFLPSIAKDLGTTVEDIRKMSREQQIPLVMKYMSSKGLKEGDTQGDYYVAIAAPGALREKDTAEVYKKGTPHYDNNTGWDLDGDGVITRGELSRYGMGERKGAKRDEPAKGGLGVTSVGAAAPSSDIEKRLLELKKRRGI
jgi:hypothetical protein